MAFYLLVDRMPLIKYTVTQQMILNESQSLFQINGYNAFSYKKLVDIIGIKTLSIHYHDRKKEELAIAVIQQQQEKFSKALNKLKSNTKKPTQSKLLNFLHLIVSSTYDDKMKMCLGGFLLPNSLAFLLVSLDRLKNILII